MSKDTRIQDNFRKYLIDNTNKYLLYYVGIGLLIICFFAYTDLYFRHSEKAFYTRLLPLIIGIPLFIMKLATQEKYKQLIFFWYNIFTASVLLMMYIKYLVYLPYDGSNYSITGIVVVIFIIALDLKWKWVPAALLFFMPLVMMIFIFVYIEPIPDSKVVNFSNLFPMSILGFVGNRIQYQLRYKNVSANYQLNQEKTVVKKLYKETLVVNKVLQNKKEEVEKQKKQIEKANNELQKINTTKDQFFSIISHDLKTPFNGMIGFSNLLNEHYGDYSQEEQKKFISIIDENINNTYRLLTNLLEWSQAQSNNDKLKLEKTNLFLLVNDIFLVLKQSAINKEIELINNIDKEIEVFADNNKLRTIIRNLLSNAIKFTTLGGKVEVNAEQIKHKEIVRDIEISVSDTGIGMTAEQKKSLFDFSRRISNPGTNKESGTGLGLMLCEEFVKRHGGIINAESETNKGSRFTFNIPQ
ncbi:sensor histidine kinase [Plebeiibacterium marinum]|uniref:histidine kinase n=1 Tax=Plebeiibacterium marinum TaxID=2992111 RepID=A0AAE3MHY8_9BACT|nr:sensor histidine kinase [Plebeiobacterium marinum]MCW3807987.1 HAMP domain-containing histidine kinase [Plebeiobacterium marinum]